MSEDTLQPDPREFDAFEALAAEFARLAGAEIVAARGRSISVSYKGETGGAEPAWKDPVTEIDHDVEVLIRARLGESFPDHDIVGEEMEVHRAGGGDFVWAIDPIDGTANFVNGLPLYAAAIGLMHRGRPIVGAIWCSATHALGPGVYHARRGGSLAFEGRPHERADLSGVRRRLVGLPGAGEAGPYDMRKTGSAAIECAFVAAGLLAAARFEGSNLWDVAGGVALVEAAGGTVLERQGGDWRPFEGFGDAEGDPAHWKGALILAESPEAAEALT